jgi:hypothetical protein
VNRPVIVFVVDCCRCSTVKSELSRVKEVVSSQEKGKSREERDFF